jgi:hypothetical protein
MGKENVDKNVRVTSDYLKLSTTCRKTIWLRRWS